ncbi:ATP-dependent helicase/nuclease subunit B [Clostridium tetanomorphum]|uniref:ATP-dependent helicase/deoxyribonuclease subunit B n=1 Tax=Clostridium tetanomorphum TaxID=1553 RepID=A0A923ECU7_CLOTT|nr:helicase-exonuclease AddAB subunit AddB [Clostridium tetanomorphum]KAJ52941.1 ATP-dependent nuclease subunit B [Clostridium tetanomorphum DSM 665]MBC2398195.1 helicase-exonuclease AddAB subunit AddB [Clostridium tetanomorphum]MBP1864881.1 ATP-dependent helicase/nuclease subunit B [Clostridium tetanomorphum]NRS83087.1 ATP-dependent helicase/nuclease subunit B [Clostridium tetanomorphum]NRZ98816.1 ATP-dependent helicase/nuclease subunit B [Clostridium tetanomorphum]
MGLRFIYGRSGSGKSHYCFEDIKRKLEKDEKSPLILLVPEQFSFQSEKNLLHYIGEEAVSRVEVLSFKRMAYRVFNEVGGITHIHINESGKSMLIYKVMDELRDKFRIFAKASKRDGFVATMSELITELKRYNITPEMLYEGLEGIEDGNLKDKIGDITLIYSKFQENLHQKYIDEDDDLTILVEKLDKSNLFKDAEIWIDEFFDFTPQEYNVLEKILKKAKRVNVTLCTDVLSVGSGGIDNLDLFYPIKNTEEKLLKIIEKNNIKYDKPIALECAPCYRFKESKELSHIEKNLFAFPYKFYEDNTEDVCIFKALNKYTEIEEVARNILKLVRNRKFRFKDIAVITGDLDGYENLARAIFSEYEIPYFIDKKIQINNNPLIVLILSSIEILSKRWNYESVFRYLKTGLTDLDKEEVDIIENYVLANGIIANKWTEYETWSYRIRYSFNKDEEIGEEEQKNLDNINRIKSKVVNPLKAFHENIREKKTAREMCTALYDFLSSINIEKKIQNWIEKFKESDRLDKVNEYSQIWNIIVELMDQIVEVMAEEKLDFDIFGKLLKNGFEEYELGLIPPALDQILVSSVDRLRSHDIKALYIVGVNDGIFPRAISAEGVLSDIERENLRSKGLELAKDTKSKSFEEQFLTYITLTTMSSYLSVSYPIADLEGKTLRPSIVVSRLKKIFPHICEKSNIVSKNIEEEELDRISSPRATFNELISQLRSGKEGLEVSSLWLSVYNWYMKDDYWKEKLTTILEGFTYSNAAEIMDTRKLRNLYGPKINLSVSRLEKYAECPFAYFIKYGLKAKERKVYKLTTPDIGTLMHEVLESFSKHMAERNITWDNVNKDLCEGIVSNIVDKKVGDMPGSILNSSPRYKHMTEGIKRILSRSVCIIGEQIKRGEFEPAGYELSFGFNGDFPPISVELNSGERVNLIGRIDRVDSLKEEDGTYIRIIDYKSGNKDFKLSDVYYGLQIQLLVYLDALLTEIEEKYKENTFPAGMLYFKVDDPIIRTKDEISEGEVHEKILKELKMKGLLLADADIIKAMDKEIKGFSDILPVRLNKDKSLSKSSSIATEEEFQLLRKYVRETIVNLCEEMLEGNIGIKPYKKKDNSTPCRFCEYSSICQFDTGVDGNNYRVINDKSDNEIWELIKNHVKNKES